MNTQAVRNVLSFPRKNSTNRQKFIQILTRRFERNYESHLSFVDIHEVRPEILEHLVIGEFLVNGADHYLAVVTESKVAGVIVFAPKSAEARQHIDKCKALLKEIALPYFEHVERAQSLRQKSLEISNDEIQNILPLFKHEQADRITRRSSTLLFTLIVGGTKEDVFQKAVEVHSQTQNFVFLPFEDITASERVKPESLRELGEATLFIKDFGKLNANEKNSLLTLAKDMDQRLLVIIAQDRSKKSLSTEDMKLFGERVIRI